MIAPDTIQARSLQREAWLVSLVLHALLLAGLLPLFRHLPVPIPRVPFRWDVTLVSTSHIEEPAESTAVPEIPSEPALPTAAALQTPQPLAPTVDSPPPSTALVKERSGKADSLLAPPIQASQQQIIDSTPAPRQPIEEQAPSSVIATAPPQQGSTIQSVHQEPFPTPMIAASEPPPTLSSSGHSSEPIQTAPVASEPLVPTRSEDITHAKERSTRPVQTESPDVPTAVQATMESPAAVSSTSVPVEREGQPFPSSAGNEPARLREAPRKPADFGWLQRTITRRLEELKRSSRPRLEQAGRVKVLVRAVVSEEGTLRDATIEQSSGTDQIDQEALALVQRTFPVAMERTLDRPQIVMRIPITYWRD